MRAVKIKAQKFANLVFSLSFAAFLVVICRSAIALKGNSESRNCTRNRKF
jgi:hypothetical protein